MLSSRLSTLHCNNLYANSLAPLSKFFLTSAITEFDSKKAILAPVAVFLCEV
jgi:hypothetical protein